MCTVLLPPGGYPIAVNEYIISHQTDRYASQLKARKYLRPWVGATWSFREKHNASNPNYVETRTYRVDTCYSILSELIWP